MNRPTLLRCFALLITVSAASLALATQAPDLRKQLKDPSPAVRKQAALTLAEANEAEAIPVLIDLLAQLPGAERRPVEEFLTRLAGEWTPVGPRRSEDKIAQKIHLNGPYDKFATSVLQSEDKIARKIHRDAWMAWWRNTEGPALLDIVREHTLTPELRRTIREQIDQLGDDEYGKRQAAMKALFNLGRVTLPQLRESIPNRDPETVRRARDLIKDIEQEPSRNLPTAAVRLLALRKPAGAVEALLAYMPLADEENLTDEVQKSLTLLALHDGKLDASLVRALSDDLPLLRAAAAEALIQGGGKEGHAAARSLLKDKATTVRMRVALALIVAGQPEAVPVLIELASLASDDQIGQIEDVLTQLAGDSAPQVFWGAEQTEKQKYRDAWAAWWKQNGERISLARLIARPWYGYTLLCDSSRNRVFELDRRGKERWAIEGVHFPVDAWVVDRTRVLIAEYMGRKISERDFHGHILWSKSVPSQPVNVQRLPDGHTFIATLSEISEVDRAGKELYTIRNVVGGITAAYRGKDGVIVCLTRNGSRCFFMDTNGNCSSQFASNRDGTWTSGIDLLANGHILITQPNRNTVTEYDRNGKAILEVKAPLATTATGLPNGHFLIASSGSRRVFEVDRKGKVVWEHKAAGNIFRARRR